MAEMELVKQASDGIWEGDRFAGNYGVYGTSPFGRSPVRLNDFGNQTVTIDTYLTLNGLRRTLSLLGLPSSLPIAQGPDEFRALVNAGNKQIVLAVDGDKSGPAMYDLWWRKDWHDPNNPFQGDRSNLWGVAQRIITLGLESEKRNFDQTQSKPYQSWTESVNCQPSAMAHNKGQMIDVNTGLPCGTGGGNPQAGGTVTQLANNQTGNFNPTMATGNTGVTQTSLNVNQPQMVVTQSESFLDKGIDIGGTKIPFVVIGIGAVAAYFAMKG